jgi:hypothetical protein
MSENSQRPSRSTILRAPICPERVRTIAGQSFAFVPHRFLREGFFAALSGNERGLYFFLVLAADRYGVSYYHYDTICSVLGIPLEAYLEARNALITKDLIAFDGTRFQVLTLPEHPVAKTTAPLRAATDLADHDPATIRSLIQRSLPPRS